MAYRDRDRGGAPPQKIYVGNLSSRTREEDLRSTFSKYGHVVDVVLKYEFAFVEMDSRKDMDEAIDALDQHECHGRRWLVEPARRGPARHRGDLSFRGDRGGSGMLRRPSGLRPSRGQYRIQILGLSSSTSWQDLKDWGRTAGNSVVFGDVIVEGGRRLGVIEYHNKDDYLYAVDHLNGDKLHGKTLSVYKDGEAPVGDGRGHRDRDRGRDHWAPRDRSRSRSRSRSRERRHRRRRHSSRERSRRKERRSHRDRERRRRKSRSSSRSSRDKDGSRSRSRSAQKSKSKSRSRSVSKSKSRSPSN